MPHDSHDLIDPAEMARMLAVQAELLALNAAIESARGGARSAPLNALADEARQLARDAHDAALRHERLCQAERDAGRILDEGLAREPIELDDPDTLARLNAAAARRLLRCADRTERGIALAH